MQRARILKVFKTTLKDGRILETEVSLDSASHSFEGKHYIDGVPLEQYTLHREHVHQEPVAVAHGLTAHERLVTEMNTDRDREES